MRISGLLAAVLAVILIYSCSNRIQGTDYLSQACVENAAFKVDTPTRGFISYATNENNKYLTIHQINVPSDTFFLRIENNTYDQVRIFEFSYYHNQSSFKIYRFPVQKGESGQILFNKKTDSLKNFTTSFDPSTKGKRFLSLLLENHILELPDYEKIPGYDFPEYTHWVSVEYSNKCIYKVFSYPDPAGQSKRFKEARSLSVLLQYLKKEFDF